MLAIEQKMNARRIRPWRHVKFEAQLPRLALKRQINSGVNTAVRDAPVMGHLRTPISWIVTEIVIADPGQSVVALHMGLRVRTRDLHAQWGGIRLQGQDRLVGLEKDAVAAAAGKIFHLAIELSLIGFEC